MHLGKQNGQPLQCVKCETTLNQYMITEKQWAEKKRSDTMFLNPSNAKATFVQSTWLQSFRKTSKSCHVGIYWKALTEYSQMSTHMSWFQSFFVCFASFCIGKISHQQHKG